MFSGCAAACVQWLLQLAHRSMLQCFICYMSTVDAILNVTIGNLVQVGVLTHAVAQLM